MPGHTPLPETVRVNPLAPCDVAAGIQPSRPLEDVHRVIARVFNVSRRRSVRDNLPYNTGQGVTRDRLGVLFKELQFTKGAEIGTSEGVFAKVLCTAHPTMELLCVDAWSAAFGGLQKDHDKRYARAQANLKGSNVRFLRKSTMDALADVPNESLDFVNIDAGHRFDEACPDIIFWARKVRGGGIVACHDYFNNFQYGVIEAVNAYTRAHRIDPWYVTLEVFPTAFWVKPPSLGKPRP